MNRSPEVGSFQVSKFRVRQVQHAIVCNEPSHKRRAMKFFPCSVIEYLFGYAYDSHNSFKIIRSAICYLICEKYDISEMKFLLNYKIVCK